MRESEPVDFKEILTHMPCEEAAWLDEGQTLKELLEFARLMLQTRRVPYQPDWDISDDLIEDMKISFKRAPP